MTKTRRIRVYAFDNAHSIWFTADDICFGFVSSSGDWTETDTKKFWADYARECDNELLDEFDEAIPD